MAHQDGKGWNPFNLYDVFGYLIPGLFFICLLTLFYWDTSLFETGLVKEVKLAYDAFAGLTIVFAIALSLMGIYIVGHAIASLSHLIFDRIIISTIFRYPATTLFKVEDIQPRNIAWPMHKAIAALIASSLVLFPFTEWTILRVDVLTIVSFLFSLAGVLTILRVTLILVKGFFEKARIWRITSKQKLLYNALMLADSVMERIFVYPIKRVLHIDQPFSDEFREKVELQFKEK